MVSNGGCWVSLVAAGLQQSSKCRVHRLALLGSPFLVLVLQLRETKPCRADRGGQPLPNNGNALRGIFSIDAALRAARMVVTESDMALAERLDAPNHLRPESQLALEPAGLVLFQHVHCQRGDDDFALWHLLAQLYHKGGSCPFIAASRSSSRHRGKQGVAVCHNAPPSAIKLPPKAALAVLRNPREDTPGVGGQFCPGYSGLLHPSVSAQSGFVSPAVEAVA